MLQALPATARERLRSHFFHYLQRNPPFSSDIAGLSHSNQLEAPLTYLSTHLVSQDSISAADCIVFPFPSSNGHRQSIYLHQPNTLYQAQIWLHTPSFRHCGGRMSSRPATPTEDITPTQQTESIRRTRSQTRRSQLSDSRRDMIATVQYQGHNPYLHPPHHHPLQDFTRHEQPSATGQPRDIFAPPGFTFDTSYNASAVTAAPLAISSGGIEGRREVGEHVKTGSQKHGHATDFDVGGARHRHASSLEESRGQTSTGTETTGETRVPTKKKRTRTLTTSNQSSVLLALLAKVSQQRRPREDRDSQPHANYSF